jgi:hypothetical protein
MVFLVQIKDVRSVDYAIPVHSSTKLYITFIQKKVLYYRRYLQIHYLPSKDVLLSTASEMLKGHSYPLWLNVNAIVPLGRCDKNIPNMGFASEDAGVDDSWIHIG